MRILVDENIPQGDTAFAPYGEVIRFHGRKLTAADLKDCQALIVRSITKVNAALLEGSPIAFVGTATIGTDHIDQAYLAQRGIGFASAPGCNAMSVADYVTALLLEWNARHGLALEPYSAYSSVPASAPISPNSASSPRLGIVGYGHVGKKVRQKALALGLEVMLCDPPLQEQGQEAALGVRFHDFQTLLNTCDIVSLHVPLIRQGQHATLNMLNLERLAEAQRMRALAQHSRPIYLLNTCRGEVTQAEALLQNQGSLLRLALDVFPGEPDPAPALWQACDFITPHIAGYSLQGKLGGTAQVLAAFCQHFALPAPSPLQEPAPQQPVIDLSVLPPTTSRLEVLRHAVRHAYDLTADDARLRKALSSDNPAAGFDQLRRDYPIRHEFTRFKLDGYVQHDPAVISTLKNLGFGVL